MTAAHETTCLILQDPKKAVNPKMNIYINVFAFQAFLYFLSPHSIKGRV